MLTPGVTVVCAMAELLSCSGYPTLLYQTMTVQIIRESKPVRHKAPTQCDKIGINSDSANDSKLRIASLKTMCGRAGEIMRQSRRKVDVCCTQETRWKGGSARLIIGKSDGYNFSGWWSESGTGVGILNAASAR